MCVACVQHCRLCTPCNPLQANTSTSDLEKHARIYNVVTYCAGEAGRPGLTRAKGPHKPLAPERVEDISQGQRDEIDAFRPSHGIPRVPPPAGMHL